jgi:hypothetical protein
MWVGAGRKRSERETVERAREREMKWEREGRTRKINLFVVVGLYIRAVCLSAVVLEEWAKSEGVHVHVYMPMCNSESIVPTVCRSSVY